MPDLLNRRLRSRPFLIGDSVSLMLAARVYEAADRAVSCEQLELEMLLQYPQAGIAAKDVQRALGSLLALGLICQRFEPSSAMGDSANQPVFVVAAPEP